MPGEPCCDGSGYRTVLVRTLPDGMQITREVPCRCNRERPALLPTDKWFPPKRPDDDERMAA